MVFFQAAFFGLCAVCAIITYIQNRGASTMPTTVSENSQSEAPPPTPDFKRFQFIYLVVYLTAVMGDWLQGPYVYALYTMYQFSKQQIGVLFIVGFGSSAIFGTVAGSFADKYGRKLSCLVYCGLYIVSCMTKHSPNFYVLLFGRFTGGIATSILFSSFESWLVAEHNKHFFPSEWLNQTFQFATIGNGVAAIIAGQLGSMVRDSFDSLVAPFDAAIVFLFVCMAVIFTRWSENKGDAVSLGNTRADGRSKFKVAIDIMKKDSKVLLLGMIQSCFEGAMYIFVFMWTPKLEPLFDNLPHGQVFGCFMACMMIGSSCTKYVMAWRHSPVWYMRDVFLLGAVSLGLPAIGVMSGYTTLAFFFVFEFVCGLYWPGMGIIKSKYVPEEVRATIYNVFRIPLNIIVVVVLSNLGVISDNAVFATCGFLLFAAAGMMHVFTIMAKSDDGKDGAAAAASDELSHLNAQDGEKGES